jgi:hypothetical protein
VNFEWSLTLGNVLSVIVPLVMAVLGVWATYLKFRTKTEVSLKTVGDQLIDTNRRVSDLGAGVSTNKTDLHDFKAHVERHYVEKDELGELKASFDGKIDRMQISLDIAVGTRSDVRDAVIILTSQGKSTTVPPARRKARTDT